MRQLRLIYNAGVDENGDPILRRQTLTVLDSATDADLNDFINQLNSALATPVVEAYRIDYTQLV